MNHKEHKKFRFINIGTPSLLVVFLTLCLVAFAMLSLSSAKNDYEFSQKLAERTTNYYAQQCNQNQIEESEDQK